MRWPDTLDPGPSSPQSPSAKWLPVTQVWPLMRAIHSQASEGDRRAPRQAGAEEQPLGHWGSCCGRHRCRREGPQQSSALLGLGVLMQEATPRGGDRAGPPWVPAQQLGRPAPPSHPKPWLGLRDLGSQRVVSSPTLGLPPHLPPAVPTPTQRMGIIYLMDFWLCLACFWSPEFLLFPRNSCWDLPRNLGQLVPVSTTVTPVATWGPRFPALPHRQCLVGCEEQ